MHRRLSPDICLGLTEFPFFFIAKHLIEPVDGVDENVLSGLKILYMLLVVELALASKRVQVEVIEHEGQGQTHSRDTSFCLVCFLLPTTQTKSSSLQRL